MSDHMLEACRLSVRFSVVWLTLEATCREVVCFGERAGETKKIWHINYIVYCHFKIIIIPLELHISP